MAFTRRPFPSKVSINLNGNALSSVKGGQPPHLVKKMKFGIFNFFLFGAVNKHPNCIKMKFEGDLTSIMVTRDFFGTATTTRFALTRQGNGCGVDGNHDVCDRG